MKFLQIIITVLFSSAVYADGIKSGKNNSDKYIYYNKNIGFQISSKSEFLMPKIQVRCLLDPDELTGVSFDTEVSESDQYFKLISEIMNSCADRGFYSNSELEEYNVYFPDKTLSDKELYKIYQLGVGASAIIDLINMDNKNYKPIMIKEPKETQDCGYLHLDQKGVCKFVK